MRAQPLSAFILNVPFELNYYKIKRGKQFSLHFVLLIIVAFKLLKVAKQE